MGFHIILGDMRKIGRHSVLFLCLKLESEEYQTECDSSEDCVTEQRQKMQYEYSKLNENWP